MRWALLWVTVAACTASDEAERGVSDRGKVTRPGDDTAADVGDDTGGADGADGADGGADGTDGGADGTDGGADGGTDGGADGGTDGGADGTDGGAGGGSGDGSGDGDDGELPLDADGDGFESPEDCDDADATVYPGAEELCDDTDRDCDGSPRGGATDKVTSYADSDADGYGDPAVTFWGCNVPAGYVSNADDCDDTDPLLNPALGCTPASWDGTYSGPAAVVATVSTLGITDTCSGTADITIAGTSASGEASCAFTGLAAALLPGTQTVTLTGTVSGATVSGTLDLFGLATPAWAGTLASPGVLTLAFSGTTTVSSFAVAYTGSGTLAR